MQKRPLNVHFLWFALLYLYFWMGCPLPIGIHYEWPIVIETILLFPLFDHPYLQVFFWGTIELEPFFNIAWFNIMNIGSNLMNQIIYYTVLYCLSVFIMGGYFICAFYPASKLKKIRYSIISAQIVQIIGILIYYYQAFLPFINSLGEMYPSIETTFLSLGLIGTGYNGMVILLTISIFIFRRSEGLFRSNMPETSQLQQRNHQIEWYIIGIALILLIIGYSLFSMPLFYLKSSDLFFFFWGSSISSGENHLIFIDLTKNGWPFFPAFLLFMVPLSVGVISIFIGTPQIRFIRIKKLMKINLILGAFVILEIIIYFVMMYYESSTSLGISIYVFILYEIYTFNKYHHLFGKKKSK